MSKHVADELKEVMGSVFNMSPTAISESTSTETLENWDSMRHMNLIVSLEETFSVEFDEDDIPEMLSFPQILQLIEKKQEA